MAKDDWKEKVDHLNKNKFCFHLQTRFAFVMNNRKPTHIYAHNLLFRACGSHSLAALVHLFSVLFFLSLVVWAGCFVLVGWLVGWIWWDGKGRMSVFGVDSIQLHR